MEYDIIYKKKEDADGEVFEISDDGKVLARITYSLRLRKATIQIEGKTWEISQVLHNFFWRNRFVFTDDHGTVTEAHRGWFISRFTLPIDGRQYRFSPALVVDERGAEVAVVSTSWSTKREAKLTLSALSPTTTELVAASIGFFLYKFARDTDPS